ncbi:helix-hairpin-helix domain-containing protein [Reichenbachiella ulvae]|uniref:Helix-hairpin-helix domain-containing protein n=1 Tax=Reichenbachiella ulvae TaxID=2980104 RepID=A0ABT3CSP7_9BACT|nr:helix-hairpin-helix domain-containing protein [Reichenbachiella ulvae]MCV9386588.1 helix-hairpin-helix domain-containing protein [Reichenbachiella ulvae]
MKRIGWLILWMVFNIPFASAQEPPRPEIDIQEFVIDLFQVPDQDINYEDLYESLYQLYLNPIDLNQTSLSELNQLYQLTPLQINQLMNYIQNHGPLLSIYEIQVLESFDEETIHSILPFVIVNPNSSSHSQHGLVKRIMKEDNTYLLLRSESVLEEKKGYQSNDSNSYLGSPLKVYGRFLSRHTGDYSLGFTFEKDPGETLAWNNKNQQYGFDYYSFHFLWENKGRLKKLALGDYQLQFGQGLIFGAGFNPGKGAETITTVRRSNTGIRPYTSVIESGFMRGAAITYSILPTINLTTFYSHNQLDANIQNSSDTESYEEYVSSILATGFHRSYGEIEKRNQIKEQSYGFNLSFRDKKSKNLEAGFNYLVNQYSRPIYRTPSNYNQFEFSGNQNYNLGLFVNYNWQNFLLFSEAAYSRSGGKALIAGFMASLSPSISSSFIYRNYAKDYHGLYAQSFAEGSRSINENGFYWGIQIKPSKKWQLSAYYDYFRFPWLRYRASAPGSGYEYLIKSDFRVNRKINLYLQYRQQSKERDTSTDTPTKSINAGVKRSFAANMDYNFNSYIGLKSRIQYSQFTIAGEESQGMTIIQDINLSFSRFRISGRFSIFETEDYENRQYVYEKDLLYAFSIPAYYGTGTRAYILLRYQPFRKLTLWAKYGRYRYDIETESIGSGNEQIIGNIKSEIKFQIRYKI